ncbi:hypothetical protein [Halorubrum halodurans]|uniref:hypothetical protein n=1 Tax=Halorubrum halodurans TaxID=1383851 RepID=UPI00117BD982|nr:hypothetical protein [Halorubrum halodurans]
MMFFTGSRPSKEELLIDRLQNKYTAGDISLDELDNCVEAVLEDRPNSHLLKETCLVCENDLSGYARKRLGASPILAYCPGCGRERPTDELPALK